MDNKEKLLLEKLFKKNQKLKDDFGYLLEVWWKVPEERSIVSNLKADHASGISTLLFAGVGGLGLLGILFMVLSMNALGVGFLLATIIMLIIALIYQSKANKLKKIAEEELERYKEALSNKIHVEQSLKNSSQIMKHEIVHQFEKSLSHSKDVSDLREVAGSLIVMIEGAKQEIDNMYLENKRFVFNLFEQEEVKAFSKVDAYSAYEKEISFWGNALAQAGYIRTLATNSDEETFVSEVNKLISQFKK